MKEDAKIVAVFDGKAIARAGQRFETRAKSFVTNRVIQWIYRQVGVCISDGKIIIGGPTLSMDADLKTAIEKYCENVRNTEHRAAYPARRRRTGRDAARSVPWWGVGCG